MLALFGVYAAYAFPAGFPGGERGGNGVLQTKMAFTSTDCKSVSFGIALGDVDPTNIATVEYWTYSEFQWVLFSVAHESSSDGDWDVTYRCVEESCGWAGTVVTHVALVNFKAPGARAAPASASVRVIAAFPHTGLARAGLARAGSRR
jgi:hypothetical protein